MKLGIDAKIYYLSTGSRATWGAVGADGAHAAVAPSSLTEVSAVKDIVVPLEYAEWNASTRGNGGFEATEPTLLKVSIDIPMIYDATNTAHMAFMKAFLKRTVIALAILDGDKATAGNEGLWADFKVIKANKGEELESGQLMTWTVKPCLSTVAPEWVRTS